jgi:hypothetical protein
MFHDLLFVNDSLTLAFNPLSDGYLYLILFQFKIFLAYHYINIYLRIFASYFSANELFLKHSLHEHF